MKKFILKNKFLLIVILLAVLVSIPNALSMYKSNARANFGISVARWSVSSQSDSDNISFISGNGVSSYNLTVTSTSDVSVKYSIELSDIPNGVLVKLDDGDYQTPVHGKVKFTDVSTLLMNNDQNSHVLTFTAPVGVTANNDMSIDVIFEQNV